MLGAENNGKTDVHMRLQIDGCNCDLTATLYDSGSIRIEITEISSSVKYLYKISSDKVEELTTCSKAPMTSAEFFDLITSVLENPRSDAYVYQFMTTESKLTLTISLITPLKKSIVRTFTLELYKSENKVPNLIESHRPLAVGNDPKQVIVGLDVQIDNHRRLIGTSVLGANYNKKHLDSFLFIEAEVAIAGRKEHELLYPYWKCDNVDYPALVSDCCGLKTPSKFSIKGLIKDQHRVGIQTINLLFKIGGQAVVNPNYLDAQHLDQTCSIIKITEYLP